MRGCNRCSRNTPSLSSQDPQRRNSCDTRTLTTTFPRSFLPMFWSKMKRPHRNDRALFVSQDDRTKLLLLGKHNPRSHTLAKIYSEWAAEHTAADPGKWSTTKFCAATGLLFPVAMAPEDFT